MNHKEQWIDEVMNSLDGLQVPMAPAGFKERVIVAIKAPARQLRFSPRVSWSLAAGFLLLVAVNAFSLAHLGQEQRRVMNETTSDFAHEYYGSITSQ